MKEVNEDDFSEDDKLKELIREALSMRIESQKHKKTQRDLDSALAGVVGEFLNSFIVIGYDFNGNPISLKLAPTIQSNEALKSLLIKVFAKEIKPLYGTDDEYF